VQETKGCTMAGVSTRSLAVRALLALLLVSGSLTHVLAKETHDERKIEKADYDYDYDYDYGDDGDDGECNYADECYYEDDRCSLECNLDFQNCLDNASTCTDLDFGYSYLTGTIPSIIGELTALTELWLGGNDLTGSLSTELGLLTELWYLDLADNALYGSLPTELELLTNMDFLDVSYNFGLAGCRPYVGNVGTSYDYDETNLGTACPSLSPTTVAPTAPTVAPTVTTVAPTVTTVAPTVTTVAPTGSPTSGGGAHEDPDPN